MTDFESGKGDKASYLEWALLIDPETVGQMRFSPAVEDTNWLIRLAKPEPQHRYEYMHQDVSGGPPVICSMWVLVNSAQLLYGKSTGQIFLKMNINF